MDQLAAYRAKHQRRFLEEKQQQQLDSQETVDIQQEASLSKQKTRSQSIGSICSMQRSFESSRPTSSGSGGYSCGGSPGTSVSGGYSCSGSPGSSRPGSSEGSTLTKRPRGSAALRAVSAARASQRLATEMVLPGSAWPGHFGDQGPLRQKSRAAFPTSKKLTKDVDDPESPQSLSNTLQEAPKVAQVGLKTPPRLPRPLIPTCDRTLSCGAQERKRAEPGMNGSSEHIWQGGLLCH